MTGNFCGVCPILNRAALNDCLLRGIPFRAARKHVKGNLGFGHGVSKAPDWIEIPVKTGAVHPVFFMGFRGTPGRVCGGKQTNSIDVAEKML